MSVVSVSAVPGTGHLFPRFHVRPPRGYLNDPNGPVFHDGSYHLYFQYRLSTDVTLPVLWGHATSTDLVRWEHRRPALVPNPVLADRDGCWSGNTVVDDEGRLWAFYSGRRDDHPYQSVLAAVSSDGGFSFGEPAEVLADPEPEEKIVTFRDPFVWRSDDGWSMIVGAGDADGVASARLYRSSDLSRWTPTGTIASSPRRRGPGLDTGEMWECPQLLDVAGTPVLLAGAWTEIDGTMAVYAVTGLSMDGSDHDRQPADVALLDHGPDFYAASVMRDSPAGALVWGWAREGRDHEWAVEDGWSGILTLPRVVEQGVNGILRVAPAPGLTALRTGEAQTVTSEASGLGAQLELVLSAPATGVGVVRLVFSAQEELRFVLDRDAGRLLIDRSRASLDSRADGGVVEIDGAFTDADDQVRVFVDGSLLEVFTGTGRAATVRCYPTTPPPYRLVVDQADAATSVANQVDGALRVDIWTLDADA